MVTPWPWSVDADGVGHFYLSKEQAVAATSKMQAAGVTSIDVGCMQINLQEHPSAFTSLDAAFDPTANTAYAAKFLWQLYYQTGNWIAAAAAYHSQTPGVSDAYRQAVIAKWRLAGPYRAQLAGASIDPYHVLTATFRRQLLEDVQFRAERDARMFGQAAAPSTVRPFEHLAVGDRSVTR
jgi:hypothetical protein